MIFEENILDCTIRYYWDNRLNTGHCTSIEFEAKEDCYQEDGKEHLYTTFDTLNDGSFTNEFEEGDKYIKGSVKWDGCSHYYFGNEGYLHLCGKQPIEQISKIIEHIHIKCGEIMTKSGTTLLNGEFKLTKQSK